MLDNNSYHDGIIKSIGEIKKSERTGKNRLITIGHLKNAANGMVCKKFITEEIEDERQQSIEIISKHLAKKIRNVKAKQNTLMSSLHC